jgi:hypothetical protein
MWPPVVVVHPPLVENGAVVHGPRRDHDAKELSAVRGAPEHLRSDNGPKFVAKEIQAWLARARVRTLYIHPLALAPGNLRRFRCFAIFGSMPPYFVRQGSTSAGTYPAVGRRRARSRPSLGPRQPAEASPRSALHCVASSSENPFQPQLGHEDSLTRPGSGFGEGVSRGTAACRCSRRR